MAINHFDVGKMKNLATGEKGYVPRLNGNPLTPKAFKRRADAEKFLNDFRQLMAKKLFEAEQAKVVEPMTEAITPAEVEASFTDAAV